MIDYLNDLIGISYSDSPMEYILCVFLIIWFMYQLFNLLYVILGLNK